MATFHIIGDTLVEPDEPRFKKLSGEMDKAAAIEAVDTPINFNNGQVSPAAISTLAQAKGFEPIGIGKPLSVEIMTIYTGDYHKFLGGKKDMIVVSGVKNAQTYDAATRAVNRLQPKVERYDFPGFGALSEGTPIVYYSPAMDSDTTFISFEIMYDNFDTHLLDAISGLLSSGAGLPVFLPAAAYLLGASQLVKLAGNVGNSLFAGKPALAGNIPVQFMSPVLPDTEPREFVIYNENDKNEFANLKVSMADVGGSTQLRLADKTTGNEYKGDAPYLIVVLDGRKRTELESFTPKVASAAILKQFYGTGDAIGAVTTALEDAMALYNDFSYKTKGESLKRQLDKLTPGSDEYAKLKVLYQAYAGNIKNDSLKLPDLS